MEKRPQAPSANEILSEQVEALTEQLQSVLTHILEGRRVITQSKLDIEKSTKDFQEMIEMLDPSDPEENKLIEKYTREHQKFVKIMEDGIVNAESIVTELETVHAEELRMFEELKAMHREQQYGSSGTAH